MKVLQNEPWYDEKEKKAIVDYLDSGGWLTEHKKTRELENLIERSYILETSSTLTPDSFPGELFAGDKPVAQITLNPSLTLSEVRNRGIENIERQYLKEILTLNKGRIDRTATHAGISTRQLHKLLTKYGIKKEEFRQ